jgi:hypothetical protein
MADATLVGVRAKLLRAQTHLESINATVKSLLGPDGYSEDVVGHQFENRELVIRARAPKSVDSNLSLVIGDCVHNLRSALDHLVLQLAALKKRTKDAERKTAFPIHLDSAAFKKATKDNVRPFISKEALAALEELQPYRVVVPGTDRPLGERSVLWVLSQLDIIDKHRVILVAQPQIAVEGFICTGGAPEVIAEKNWKPLAEGQELIRFKGALAGKLRLEFATIIHFKDTGLCCDGMGVQSTLENLLRVVKGIVDDFEKRFFH